MQLRLEKRAEPSRLLRILTPIGAVLLTMAVGAIVFTLIGYDGFGAVREIFIFPLVNSYKWQDLAVKAAPLILIAVGLAVAYRANVWNIGAEGQYVLGGLVGTGIALATRDFSGPWILPLMILGGMVGGMAWASLPALLKTRLQVNEILTSLMLTYVSIQLLNYLVIGPWKDPKGFGFPQTAMFTDSQVLPKFVPGTIVHWGVPIAIIVALGVWFFMSRTVLGYQVKVVGSAPDAARHGGFSVNKTIWLALLGSGALAGLAGVLEATGPFGRLVPAFPTNYGFTAIIVAFLGRLHPVGIIFAGLALAVSAVGGEVAQTTIKLPVAAVGIFQSMMLFFLLATDVFVRYRLRVVRRGPAEAAR